MANQGSASSGGIGFTGLLTIVFVTLKLLGKISWSWWWVLSPLWIGGAVFLVFMALFVGIALASGPYGRWRE
jgi:hypothetical protein